MFLCEDIDNHEMHYSSVITLLIFHNTLTKHSQFISLLPTPLDMQIHYTSLNPHSYREPRHIECKSKCLSQNIIISNIIFTTVYLPPTNGIQVSRLPLMIRIVIWFSLPLALHIATIRTSWQNRPCTNETHQYNSSCAVRWNRATLECYIWG